MCTAQQLYAQTTLYVSPSGSDSNPGTATQPFRTIQRAADLVNPGDTVIVEDGVYTGVGSGTPCGSRPILCVHRGGTASAPVTFRARNKWGARLDGQQNTSTDGVRVISGASYVRIEGFEIFGGGNSSGSGSGVELYSGGANSVIAGNHIHDMGRLCTDTTNGQVGIYVRQPGVVITGNRIHDIGRLSPGEQGCSPTTPYYQNNDHGVYVSGASTPGPADLVISNNVFYNNQHGWSVHLYPGTLNNVSILNNTFAFPNPYRDGHIIIYANTSNTRIINNVFYRPNTAAIRYSSGTQTGLEVTNNVVSNGTIMTAVPSGTTLAANQVVDPLLINTSSAPYDFHLSTPSPAINAGITVPEVTVDFDGKPRATGVYDAGAFEYGDGTLVQVAAPAISPSGGTITGPTAVTISTATSGASIRYTLDGSQPSASSPVYSGAFTIDTSVTVKAQAFKSGMQDSQVSAASFQMSGSTTDPTPTPTPSDTTPPTVSITAPEDQARITKNGPVTIAATASDDVAVKSVQFTVDGQTIATDTTAPYSVSYRVNKLSAGTHVIAATATDTAGNTATATISVSR